MSKCENCKLGIYSGFITEMVDIESLNIAVADINFQNETRNVFFGTAEKTDYTARDFLDRRKHLIEYFNYCPICGNKIDKKYELNKLEGNRKDVEV